MEVERRFSILKKRINYYNLIEKTKQKIILIREALDTYSSAIDYTEVNNQKAKLFGLLKEYQEKLQIVNSTITPVSVTDFDSGCVANKFEKINLIIPYYDEPIIERRKELIFAIKKNIKNKFIDKVCVFLETNRSTRTEKELKQDIFSPELSKKVEFILMKRRTRYADVFKFTSNYENSIFILVNSDCYFNKTIDLIKKIDFMNGNRMICLTRKDRLKNGKIVRAKNPPLWSDSYNYNSVDKNETDIWKLLDYNSTDAWIFNSNMTKINDNIVIGTYHCEHFLMESAHLNGIQLRNPSEYIDCIHVHTTQFRRKHSYNNIASVTKDNKLYPKTPEQRTKENRIVGTWRLRSKYNYIDKNTEMHEYSEYVVVNLYNII